MKYRFSGFLLEPSVHRLSGPDGRRISLNSRVFDTLLYLVEHPGELLDKATLMQAVWPDTVVEENNLSQAITALRKVFKEKPGDHRFIVTEPGRGYRFVAPVEAVEMSAGSATANLSHEAAPAAAPPQATGRLKPMLVTAALVVVPALIVSFLFLRQSVIQPEAAPPPEPVTSVLVEPLPVPQSVAVLPFADMSPGQDQAYFADGIAEELLNELSRVEGLHVAGRTSSFSFRNKDEDLRAIGRALNVAHILEGSVRKASDRVRISVQLVKATDGYHLWSQTFDRDLKDIFVIQEEIAVAVAEALSVTLGVGGQSIAVRKPPSFEAYDDFLEARALTFRQGRDNIIRAIELLEGVVHREPGYAEAWSLLSTAYWWGALLVVNPEGNFLRKRAEAAARAVEIAPESLSSLRVMAGLYTTTGNWIDAERKYRQVLSAAPMDFNANLEYGYFLQTVGRPGDAIQYCQWAIQVEPLALAPSLQLAMAYQTHGEKDAALKQLERSESLIGDRVLLNGQALILAMELGNREMERRYLEIIRRDPTTPEHGRAFIRKVMDLHGSPGSAREFLYRARENPVYQDSLSQAVIAQYASYYGEHELALQILRELHRDDALLFDGLWREIYASTRREPGFRNLVREAGLYEYWRESGNWGEFCSPLGEDDFECR